MVTVAFELPEDVFSSVRKDPDHFAEELRLAAAVKWYEMGLDFPRSGDRDFRAIPQPIHLGIGPVRGLRISV